MKFLDINTFLSPRGGGIRTYHAKKAAWFERQDRHEYHTLQPSSRRSHRASPSGKVHTHQAKGLPIGDNYRFLWDLQAAGGIQEEFGIDCIEAGDPWATSWWTARRADVLRTGFWHSDPHTAYLQPWTPRLGTVLGPFVRRSLERWVDSQQKRLDLVWCASRWVRDLQVSRGVEHAELLPFGIDHEDFQPQPSSPELVRGLGLDPERPIILWAGRLNPEKGTRVFEESIPGLLALPGRPQIVVAGRGEQQARFQDRTEDGFRFLGFVEDPGKLKSLYASSTILLSACAVETFGLGVLESLHMGLPVVSASTGGGGEQVSDSGGGEVFEPDDAASLVSAAGRALQRRRELSRRALLWGAAWPSWDRMFELQSARLEELAAARRGTRP